MNSMGKSTPLSSNKHKLIMLALILCICLLITTRYEVILTNTGTILCTGYHAEQSQNGPHLIKNIVSDKVTTDTERKCNCPLPTPPMPNLPSTFGNSEPLKNLVPTVSGNPVQSNVDNSVTVKTTDALQVNDTITKPSSGATTRPTPKTIMPPMEGSKYVVPNIAHYIWYTTKPKTFKFHHLLSMLSVYRFMRPDTIYFHCNYEPIGPYWDEAKNKIPSIVIRGVDPPTVLFGVKLKPAVYDATDSDADRLRIIQENGGVYLDLDVWILKPLDPLRIHPTTLGFETGTRICGGFIMSAPHAPFIYLWIDNMLNDYQVDEWAYISGTIPTLLAERYRGTGIIHLESRSLHKPGWDQIQFLIGPNHYDWSQNYAVHLWYRLWERPQWNKWKIEPSPESIKKWNTTLGQISRMIYYGSKDLIL